MADPVPFEPAVRVGNLRFKGFDVEGGILAVDACGTRFTLNLETQ
jgi:hypothetical protein